MGQWGPKQVKVSGFYNTIVNRIQQREIVGLNCSKNTSHSVKCDNYVRKDLCPQEINTKTNEVRRNKGFSFKKHVIKYVFPFPFATMSESRLPVTQRWVWKCGHKEKQQYVHIYIHHDTVTTVRSFWLQIQAKRLKHTAHVWKNCLYTSKHVSDGTAVFLQRDFSPCVFHFCVSNELLWPAQQRTAFRVRISKWRNHSERSSWLSPASHFGAKWLLPYPTLTHFKEMHLSRLI